MNILKSAPFLASLVLLIPPSASAMVDEAHSLIMEVAAPFVEEGFTIRADYWNGKLETGKQKLIRHQLFRGNEYWFWLATSDPGCSLKIEVYDAEGQAVTIERTDIPNCAGARVTPTKTGSYYILVKIDWEEASKAASNVGWAVAYGYR